MENSTFQHKVVVIDDEKHGRELLKKLILLAGEDFIISGEANSVDQAIQVIKDTKPNLIFLDIELFDRSGFEVLEHFENANFSVIFATAYNYYAIKAIKFSALDYLLKPIDPDELKHALEKYKTKGIETKDGEKRLSLARTLINKPTPDKIALPTNSGYIFIEIDDIVRCSSENNYTRFFLKNKTEVLVCHTLKEYEILLEGLDFFRVHHSHLINMKLVQSYLKGKGGFVMMKDGSQIEVSTRRKDLFLKQFAKL